MLPPRLQSIEAHANASDFRRYLRDFKAMTLPPTLKIQILPAFQSPDATAETFQTSDAPPTAKIPDATADTSDSDATAET
jgi:hypothetical protein